MLPEKIFLRLINKSVLSELVGEPVSEFSVNTGSKQGDNVAGSLVAVDIRGASKSIYHIVIKTPPYDNPSTFYYTKYWRVFELENRFYGHLIPELEKLLKTRNPSAPFEIKVPRYLGGSRSYLALEDVRPEGYKMADKFQGLSFPEVSLVMRNLGQFHASTYSFLRDSGEGFFRLEENLVFNGAPLKNVFLPEIDSLVENIFDKICLRGFDLIGKINGVVGGKLQRKYGEHPIKRALSIHGQTDKKYFPIISHGDIWANNLLFTYDNNGQPKECMMLDFQQTRRENIFWDLLYFFYCSTTPEFRKEFLLSSLMIYYENFVRTLELYGTSLPRGFTRGWLVDEFYANIQNIYCYMPFAISLQLGDFTVLGLDSPKPVDVDKLEREDEVVPWEAFYEQLYDMCSSLLELSPEAMRRLQDITKELDDLGIFDA